MKKISLKSAIFYKAAKFYLRIDRVSREVRIAFGGGRWYDLSREEASWVLRGKIMHLGCFRKNVWYAG